MKYFKLISILIVFLKTGNVLSEENIFNVNNIQIAKKTNISNNEQANKAVRKGFNELLNRILLDQDMSKLKTLSLAEIKDLVSYYQLVKNNQIDNENKKEKDLIYFNIFFDKEKIHELFYSKKIFYSEIADKELYLLPILKKGEKYYIFNQNFFYENWNKINHNDLIEFILPIENIEIIQKINLNKNNIIDINLENLFKEYQRKNLAFIFIEEIDYDQVKIFLKTSILGKKINKNMIFKKDNTNNLEFFDQVIIKTKKEIINLVKSQNLIDVRTPSFLNVKLILDKKMNNLVELKKRLKRIDSIENIYVQELNNEYVFLKIKYLGKLNKIIRSLKSRKIILEDYNNQWNLKIL